LFIFEVQPTQVMSDQLKKQMAILNNQEVIEFKQYLMGKIINVNTKPNEVKRLSKLIKEVDKFL
jgi:hypothetical protein